MLEGDNGTSGALKGGRVVWLRAVETQPLSLLFICQLQEVVFCMEVTLLEHSVQRQKRRTQVVFVYMEAAYCVVIDLQRAPVERTSGQSRTNALVNQSNQGCVFLCQWV